MNVDASVLRLCGEIVGAVAIAEGFLIYFSKTKERMLICKFLSDFLWLVNLLCLGGWTGALLNAIAMGRETVFYLRDRKPLFAKRFWLWLFLAVTLISPAISLVKGDEGLFALLPAFGSAFAVFAFYHRDPAFTRRVGLLSQVLWLLYAIGIHNVSSAVCNGVLILSALCGMARQALANRRENTQA